MIMIMIDYDWFWLFSSLPIGAFQWSITPSINNAYLYYLAIHGKKRRARCSTGQQDWTMFCCPRCSHLSTILNNIVEPELGVTILFNIIDKCEQCGQQSIVQSCFHQHCNNLIVVFLPCILSLDYLFLQHLWYYFPNYVILTHPVNFPCGRKPEHAEKPTTFGRALTDSHMSPRTLESIARIEPTISEVKGACSDDCATHWSPLPPCLYVNPQ